MNVQTFNLPAHWAVVFVNDDRTGMTDQDEAELDSWFDYTFPDGAHCVDVSSEEDGPGFLVDHDARAHGVLACDCLTYSFDVPE